MATRTFTFAENDAPVSEHMRGLVQALRMWVDREEAAPLARTQREQLFRKGRIMGYREVIAIIENSNSID
jgi:hypothetical protein